MYYLRLFVGLFVVLLLTTACINKRIYTPHQSGYRPPQPAAPVGGMERFSYRQTPIHADNHELKDQETDLYRVYRLRFPSIGENGQEANRVEIIYYRSKLPGKKKLVMILPIWGSYTYPPRKFAAGIRNRSHGKTNTIYIMGKNYLFAWDEMAAAATPADFRKIMRRMAGRYRSHVIDIRRIMDWATQQADIHPQQIALMGFSMSALVASNAIGIDDRLAAGVLVMGAANPDEVFATCFGKVGIVRDALTKRFGWTVDQYRLTIKKIFEPLNPIYNAINIDPRRVLIIDSHRDDCMPATAREALWNFFGRPERYSFLYKHKLSFYSMTPLGSFYMRYRVYEFLDKMLK